MKNSKLKLLVAIMVFCILVMMPIFTNAANDDLAIVKTGEKNYLIYINEYLNQNFKFAFSDKSDTPEAQLNFINSSLDQDAENPSNLAYIKENTYSDQEIYMWVKNEEGKITEKPITIKLSEAVNKEDIETVEQITKKISVDTTQKYEYPEQIIDGYKKTVVTGKIEITDTEKATYFYEQTAVTSNVQHEELMRLAELIHNNFNTMTITQKINTEKSFYELYNTLIKQAKWTKVEGTAIPQPLEAQRGDKYVVFLKKVEADGTETLDAQFMICEREEAEGGIEAHTEKRDKIVNQTSKLPITYDSIILFVILGVIILAIIFIILRKKNINKNARH